VSRRSVTGCQPPLPSSCTHGVGIWICLVFHARFTCLFVGACYGTAVSRTAFHILLFRQQVVVSNTARTRDENAPLTCEITHGSNYVYLRGPDSFSVSTGGRNVCLAFLAELPSAGCSSHERHDIATLDDDELAPIVQQKLQEIQSWITCTHISCTRAPRSLCA
jgi:hypothetical protein